MSARLMCTDISHKNTLLLALKLVDFLPYGLSDATLDRSGEEQADGNHCSSQEGRCQPQSTGGLRRVGFRDVCCAPRFHDDNPHPAILVVSRPTLVPSSTSNTYCTVFLPCLETSDVPQPVTVVPTV